MLLLCRLLVLLAGRTLPSGVRESWERDWLGEIVFYSNASARRQSGISQLDLVKRAMGAFADARSLREREGLPEFLSFPVLGRPVFCIAALALSIAAIAAFSRLQTTARMAHPFPYTDGDRLVMLSERWFLAAQRTGLNQKKIRILEQGTSTIETAAGVRLDRERIAAGAMTADTIAATVTPSFFSVLGLAVPESKPGCVVASAALCSAVRPGSTVSLSGKPYPVAACLPPEFWFLSDHVALWRVAPTLDPEWSDKRFVMTIGKLRPGASAAAATEEIRDLTALFDPRLPDARLELLSLQNRVRTLAFTLLAAAGLLLVFSLFHQIKALVNRKTDRPLSPRFVAFALGKDVLIIAATVLLVMEAFGPGPSGPVAGGGFVRQLVAFWLTLVIGLPALAWSRFDNRRRCPKCATWLTRPVRIGTLATQVLDESVIEWACPNDHGFLLRVQAEYNGYPEDRWVELDTSWFEAGV